MLLPDIVRQQWLLDEGFMHDAKQLVLLSEAILKTYSDANTDLA